MDREVKDEMRHPSRDCIISTDPVEIFICVLINMCKQLVKILHVAIFQLVTAISSFLIVRIYKQSSDPYSGALFLISLFLMVVFPTFIIPTLQYS
jgi:hypothetical protein